MHAYFGVDWGIVWEAATADVTVVRDHVSHILAVLPPEE